MGVQETVQQAIQSPATGLTVGGGTFAYGWLIGIASTAQAIGMICGAILSAAMLIEYVIRKWKAYRGSES